MKQYLLIPIEEIDSRIKELGHLMKIADDDQALEEFSNKRDECFNLKQKGEIVEIEDFNEEWTVKDHILAGFKLIKMIK